VSRGGRGERYSSIWRNPDFRRFLAGEFVTNLGDSLYSVATLWFVFELTESSLLVGVVNFLLLFPWLLQFAAGPVVDRVPPKRLLVGLQLGQGVVVLVLPVALFTGRLSIELLLLVVPVLSVMALLLTPVQTATLPRILDDDRLSRGNSLMATATLGLDTVFEAVGGLLIPTLGVATLLVVDAASFGIAALLFAGMVIPAAADDETPDSETTDDETPEPATPDTTSDTTDSLNERLGEALEAYVDDLRDGASVLRGTVFVEMMFTSAVFHLALGVMLTVLPAYAGTFGGAQTYGLLLGAFGVGRIVGSALGPYLDGVRYGYWRAATCLVSAVLWVGSVTTGSRLLTLVLFGLAWVPAGANGVLVATLNQRVFPQSTLGRIAGIKGTASTATLPVGSLLGGVVGQVVGAPTAMALAAFGFAFTGVAFLLRRRLRRIPAVGDADASQFAVGVDEQ
jgi:MFS family permease